MPRLSLRPHLYLLAEFLALFIGLPLVILFIKSRMVFIGLLWLTALFAFVYLKRYHRIRFFPEWRFDAVRTAMVPVLWRFAVLAPVFTLLAYLDKPEDFLNFPLHRPRLWLMIMVLYPVLSVWPQELLFRKFIHCRYRALISSDRVFISLSALSFGFAHIIMMNAPAVIVSTIGGFLFAHTYIKRGSLGAACLEHALYGCLAFTIGLGRYFYSGHAWS